jgi:glycosyltransferase involved in cell wall biosynthesis
MPIPREESTPLQSSSANCKALSHRILIVNSHPIQYFVPLYRSIQEAGANVTVLYCSKHGLEGETDKEFGVSVKWDIPILEGYTPAFFKNYSFKSSVYGFLGLINFGLIPYLFKAPRSVLIVYGWGYFSYWLAIIFGKLAGHTICVRGDTNNISEGQRAGLRFRLRKFVLGKILFRMVDYCLYIGNENKQFYQSNEVPEIKLGFSPFSVDNNRFRKFNEKWKNNLDELKKSLGLPLNKKIILFSGKFISIKRPLDLLKAFRQCRYKDDAALVFMGEGDLRKDMEAYIEKNNLNNVLLTGFVNQSKVSEYYAVSSILIMCSEKDAWGLSVNEAMNFSMPIILSDTVGSASDLVEEGKNGYVYPSGDVSALAEKMDMLLSASPEKLEEMGAYSKRIIDRYSYDENIKTLFKICEGL